MFDVRLSQIPRPEERFQNRIRDRVAMAVGSIGELLGFCGQSATLHHK
jgi:hypothetical protein